MSGFTKLVPEIVLSSIWNESPEVRCVWIAMLATKDENGYVRGNAASLARIANVSLESAKEAIEKFQLPDPESNTPDNDGRRIQAVPGGWFVLNHALYRGKDYREYEAERKREYRRKHPLSGTRPGHVPDASASASASVSASEKKDRDRVQGKGKGKGKDSDPQDFELFWSAYPRKVAKGAARKAWAATSGKRPPVTEIVSAVTAQAETEQWREAGGQYIPHPATWLRAERWGDVVNDRPIWTDCSRRCKYYDIEKRWCSKFVRTEPKSCEQCKEF